MTGLSNYSAQNLLNYLVGAASMPALPASEWLALFTAVGTDSGSGMVEPGSGTGYLRAQIAGSLSTTSGSASGSAALNITGVPAWIQIGMLVTDTTTPASIPVSSYVIAKTSGSVTLSNILPAVASGDSIRFTSFSPSVTGQTYSLVNGAPIVFPQASVPGYTCPAFGIFDASGGGNMLTWDFFGLYDWNPFSSTSGASGNGATFLQAGHGFSNGNGIIVSPEFGGTLPTTTQGTLSGYALNYAANVAGDSYTLSSSSGAPSSANAVWTSNAGGGQARRVTPVVVPPGVRETIPPGNLYLSTFVSHDPIAGSVAAYSLRKLRPTYSGKAVNVRRSSDDAALDIGFSGNDFDVAGFNAFVGGGSGFVQIWYDQSGNGRDVSDLGFVNQPRLVLNATPNGRPALSSQVTNGLGGSVPPVTLPFTLAAVASRTGALTDYANFFALQGPGGARSLFYLNSPGMGFGGTDNITEAGITDNQFHSAIGVMNGASSSLTVDGVTTSGTLAMTSNVFTPITGNASYKLVFDDEFNGSTLDLTKWFGPIRQQDNTYTPTQAEMLPGNVTVHDGLLDLAVTRGPTPGGYNYGTASITTKGSTISGQPISVYWEARIKNMDNAYGLATDWWTDASGWVFPEVDFTEYWQSGGGPNQTLQNYNDGTSWVLLNQYNYGSNLALTYHVYGCWWTPAAINFYIDGVLTSQTTTNTNKTTSMWYGILNAAVGGGGVFPDGTTVLPNHVLIDYVHVYSAQSGAVAVSADTGYGGPGATTQTQIVVPAYAMSGLTCEAIYFDGARSAPTNAALYADQKNYWGTP